MTKNMQCPMDGSKCRTHFCKSTGECVAAIDARTANEDISDMEIVPDEATIDAINASLLARYWRECAPYRRPPEAEE